MSVRSSADTDVFFASVAGMAAALLAGELLFRWLSAAGAGPFGASLVARTAALSSVRPLYAMFVLLPAGLAFLAIGLPFFLRVVTAALRGRLDVDARAPLAALGLCAVAAAAELGMGGDGTFSVAATLLIATFAARGTIARIGERYGALLLVLAGVSLAALAWYENAAAAGTQPSIALAPTALVSSAFFGAVSLVAVTAAALVGAGEGRISAALCLLATVTWAVVPLARGRLAETAAAADTLELRSTAAAAAIFLAIGVVRRLRS